MKNKAITLISLVITIVILIILAGVAIYLSLENNGIFNRAKFAKQEYINATKEEQKQLNDAYGQMLVATGEDATVTITMKQLNELIDEKINSKLYIDTSRKIADIGFNIEYESTEDCIIIGCLSTNSRSTIIVQVDGIVIGMISNNNPSGVGESVYYNLKEGQKIMFATEGDNCSGSIAAYSTL